MTVEIKPEQETFVSMSVRLGKYPSAADAVEAALRLLEARDRYGIPNQEILEAFQASPCKDVELELPERTPAVAWRDLPSFE